MKSLWHVDPKTSELRERELVDSEKELVIQSAYSSISAGTESLVAKGGVDVSLQEYMQVPNMVGGFDLPIKYGYSLVGITDDGKNAHVMHPHQDEVSVQSEEVYYLPKNLPLERACLVSNLETVINAIWDSNPQPSDQIAICGFGGVGALLANTLRVHYGIEVDVIEVDQWRCDKATELGWELSDREKSYDIIYHTTASEPGLQYSIDSLSEEGRVIELSWYGNQKVNLSLGHDFHYKRLKIISSQVSVIPKEMRDQYNYKTRKDLAAKYLLDDSYDKLISGVIAFDEAPEFFNKLRSGLQGDGLIRLIKY